MPFIGKYRAVDGDFIDMTDKETQGWMRSSYPAIMSERAINMSESYQFMPSYKIAERLQSDYDMKLVEVSQQFSRRRDPRGQEHFLKFTLPTGLVSLSEVGDSRPEMVIMNSHNGRSTIRALAGVFRMVCSNGMIVSERSFGQIKLRHFGEKNSFAEFGKTLEVMARNMTVLDARMGRMRDTIMTKHQQNQLAKAMIKARGCPGWVDSAVVLNARRVEDAALESGERDLWTTYNVIQENLMSTTIQRNVEEGVRGSSIRPINGARASVLLNEKLWETMEGFIEESFPLISVEIMDPVKLAGMAGTKKVTAPKVIAAPKVRTFEEIIGLKTAEEILAVTEEEKAAMTSDQKKKFSSRKSYLAKKVAA